MNREISDRVFSAVYAFIATRYDPNLAAFVFELFDLDHNALAGRAFKLETFCRMLEYLVSLSGDPQIACEAGVYFKRYTLDKSGIILRLGSKTARYYTDLGRLLVVFFPSLSIEQTQRGNRSRVFALRAQDEGIYMDYYLGEFFRGLLAVVPCRWHLPRAKTRVLSYPLSLDGLLRGAGTEYYLKNRQFYVLDQAIAREQTSSGSKPPSSQLVIQDLYLENIFIPKNTILGDKMLKISVAWIRRPGLFLPTSLLALCGMAAAWAAHLHNWLSLQQAASAMFSFVALLTAFYHVYKFYLYKKLFEKAEQELSAGLAAQVAATNRALGNTYQRLNSIENMVEITKGILYEKNIAALTDNIRRLTAKALDADRATVFIHDKENKELTTGPQLSEEAKEIRFPEDKGIAGQVLKLEKTINVKDAYNHPLFNKAVDRQTGFTTRNILCAPLFDLENNILGVIQVLNKKGGAFEDFDEQVLSTLSTYIAIALKDSLAMSKLQIQGINPQLLKGLGTIIKHIFNKYKTINDTITKMENQTISIMRPIFDDIYTLLDNLKFIFAEDYIPEEKKLTISETQVLFYRFIKQNQRERQFVFTCQTNLPADYTFNVDLELFHKSVFPVLENSLQFVQPNGDIQVKLYLFAELPNLLVHDLGLAEICDEYNTFQADPRPPFIEFVGSRKPFSDEDVERIRVRLQNYLAVEIFNTGSIIQPEIKQQIFNPFFTTKNSFGLGLSLAKAAATRSGGRIEPPVNTANGTMLKILIPLHGE